MIASLTSKVEGFESILKEVKDSQNFISGMYDEMLNEIKELKKQNQSFKHEVVGLKRKVEDRDDEIEELRVKVNNMDQYNRRFNLEINGVQDAGKEDTIKILERVCGEINVTFDSQHIQAAHPLKQHNAEHPPTLIVQFTRKDVRDQWITQGRKKPTKMLQRASLKSILMKNLTTVDNRKLHRETRLKAKDRDYKFVWVKNGKNLCEKK
ncbi:uncharacterized protein LOC124366822 [Homalodisca vitripennis]|uniref:uncharacterized protein LOC124366822 n=1 Tax=Homalodisca vitripennis TaxID=197043 RepID=UPI001EE9F9B4|nr:uncharacterized protein LOC124366822 [Homalodisca vitripennis]